MKLIRRPLREADVPALCRLYAAAEKIDDVGENLSEQDIADLIHEPSMDLDRDTMAVLENDQLIAAVHLVRRRMPEPPHRTFVNLLVRPDRRGRGHGHRLARWSVDRARQTHRELGQGEFGHRDGLEISGWIDERNPAAVTMSAALGFHPIRWYSGMTVELAALDLPAARGDVTVTPYGPELQEATRLARNDAFRDHWGSTPTSAEKWAWFNQLSASRPEDSFVVLGDQDGDQDGGPDGEVAAFVLTSFRPADEQATGRRDLFIELVGTRRGYRGRGLAGALLAHTLRAAAGNGYDTASLSVDSDSPTGATGLYEKLGFRTERTMTTVARFEPPES